MLVCDYIYAESGISNVNFTLVSLIDAKFKAQEQRHGKTGDVSPTYLYTAFEDEVAGFECLFEDFVTQ